MSKLSIYCRYNNNCRYLRQQIYVILVTFRIVDPPIVAATTPNQPIVETDRTCIKCKMTAGFPNWLDEVTWEKNGELFDTGNGLNTSTINGCGEGIGKHFMARNQINKKVLLSVL